MDRARLERIRNYQSQDWYPAVFMRPLTILVMLVIADWRWVTPNFVTALATIVKLAAAAVICVDEPAYRIAGAILIQVGLLLDHLDGTLARYRRTMTKFGSFFDKVSDYLTWCAITLAVGWLAFVRSDDGRMLMLAAVGAIAFAALGYFKWLDTAESAQLDWFRARQEPDEVIASKTAPPRISVPPARTRRDWLVWYGKSWLKIFRFDEMDLYFWVGLLLILDQPTWIAIGLAATQTVGMLGALVKRGVHMRRVDAELQRYRQR